MERDVAPETRNSATTVTSSAAGVAPDARLSRREIALRTTPTMGSLFLDTPINVKIVGRVQQIYHSQPNLHNDRIK